MKLSKGQQQIVDELLNGGVLWQLGGAAYIAKKDKDGRVKSEHVHLKTFHKLIEQQVIEKGEDGKWYLKQ